MAFTSETKKELENYISGHLPNKEWYESHFYPSRKNLIITGCASFVKNHTTRCSCL